MPTADLFKELKIASEGLTTKIDSDFSLLTLGKALEPKDGSPPAVDYAISFEEANKILKGLGFQVHGGGEKTNTSNEDAFYYFDLDRINPFYVEQNLKRALYLLEECLNLRVEFFALKTEAFLQASNLAIDVAISKIASMPSKEAKEMGLIQLQNEISRLELSRQSSIQVSEGLLELTPPKTPDEKPAKIDELRGAYMSRLLEREKIFADSRDSLKDLSEKEGSAFHFEERASLVKARFDEKLFEAWGLTNAVALGLRKVYGIKADLLPGKDEPGVLDRLARWARATSRRLEKLLRLDYEYSLAISLKLSKDSTGYIVKKWGSKEGEAKREDSDTLTAEQDTLRFCSREKYILPNPAPPSAKSNWGQDGVAGTGKARPVEVRDIDSYSVCWIR